MRAIAYEIERVRLPGFSITPFEFIKSQDCREVWEAEANHVSLELTFESTAVQEVRLGVITGVLFRVEAGSDRLMKDKVVLVDRVEAPVTKGCRMAKYELTEVHYTQFPASCFSRATITIENAQKDRRIRVGHIGLYHKVSPFPSFTPSKRTNCLLDCPGAVLKPPILKPTPPSRIPLDVSVQLLNDCTVTSLGYSEHVQALCRVLGASYLDHVEKRTTHVIMPESGGLDDEVMSETNAKLVSVTWLEKCLFEKARLPEEDYELL